MKKLKTDAGHGGNDPGTSQFGYVEKDITLVITKRVNELLDGPDTTRSFDQTVEPNIRTSMIKDKYEYCISIHLNSGGGNGIEAIYSAFSAKGKALAESIVTEMKKSTGLPLRNASTFSRTRSDGKDYYYMQRDTGSTVTVIIECMFLDNAENIKKMNIEQIAQAIATGYKEFIKSQPTIPSPIVIPTPTVTLLTYTGSLKRGANGATVRALQIALQALGHYDITIDGSFGNGTDAAVRSFQKANKLVVDGLAGPATVSKINSILINMGTPNTIPKPTPSNSGYRKIRRFSSDVHIYELDKLSKVDVELGKRNALEKPSTILKDLISVGREPVAAINCGFVDYTGNKDHLGMFIDEGSYYFPPHNAQIDFIYYKDGTTMIKNLHGYDQALLSALQGSVHFAIGTSYSLVQYGKINLENYEKYSHSTQRHPRTLFGQKKDGTFIMVVVDGRNISSLGVTAQQSAEIMFELGVYNAVNFDGGGSSVLVTVENGITRIRNKVSDGNERAVGSILIAY